MRYSKSYTLIGVLNISIKHNVFISRFNNLYGFRRNAILCLKSHKSLRPKRRPDWNSANLNIPMGITQHEYRPLLVVLICNPLALITITKSGYFIFYFSIRVAIITYLGPNRSRTFVRRRNDCIIVKRHLLSNRSSVNLLHYSFSFRFIPSSYFKKSFAYKPSRSLTKSWVRMSKRCTC